VSKARRAKCNYTRMGERPTGSKKKTASEFLKKMSAFRRNKEKRTVKRVAEREDGDHIGKPRRADPNGGFRGKSRIR